MMEIICFGRSQFYWDREISDIMLFNFAVAVLSRTAEIGISSPGEHTLKSSESSFRVFTI